MGKKYIVTFERENCIGAAACEAISPKKWKMQDDAKASLLDPNAKKTAEIETLEFDESDLQEHLEAAQACPVNVIKIKEKDTGREMN